MSFRTSVALIVSVALIGAFNGVGADLDLNTQSGAILAEQLAYSEQFLMPIREYKPPSSILQDVAAPLLGNATFEERLWSKMSDDALTVRSLAPLRRDYADVQARVDAARSGAGGKSQLELDELWKKAAALQN